MRIGATTMLREHECPACHKLLDACSGVDTDETPQAGDITICIGCRTVLIFNTPGHGLRVMKPEEEDALDDETLAVITQARAAIKAVSELH